MLKKLYTTLVILFAYASVAVAQAQPLFKLVPWQESGVRFTNYLIETEEFNIHTFIYAYNGGGVAAGDVNGDGLPDLYFTGTQAHSPNRLYVNKGNFRFQDISAEAGVDDSVGIRSGVVMIDIDNDGDLDIYVSKHNKPNTLFINNGDLTFTEEAAAFGLDYCCSAIHSAFLDYDRDGDLDVYLVINGPGVGTNYTNKGWPDKLYRNNGDNTFTDVSQAAGIGDRGYGLSATVGDMNNDGWPDIYVANDFEIRDILYINNQDGTFTEATKQRLKHSVEFGMGSDIADFNNDGWLDIVTVDMLPEKHERKMAHMGSQSVYSPLYDSTQLMRNALQLNRGNGLFSDVGQIAGISETDWSWAPLFADYDNDGDLDLYITNGYKREIMHMDVIRNFQKNSSSMEMLNQMPSQQIQNFMFRNNGDLTFTKVTEEWGLGELVNSNGATYVDLDLDGDLDLVINNIDSTAFIYKNMANEAHKENNFLRVAMDGTNRNRFGLGVRVTIQNGNETQMREFYPSRGFYSSVEYTLHFGLGSDTVVNKLTIAWPDGATEVMEHVPANQTLTIRRVNAEGPAEHVANGTTGVDTTNTGKRIFTELPRAALNFSHKENPFDDFDRERLLPNRLSRNGPGIAVGDADGDELDDVYMAGPKFGERGLYLQQTDGTFTLSPNNATFSNPETKWFEELGALFFDADNDSDLDLYIVTGGNEYAPGDTMLQDRLYINNGSGGFSLASDALPNMLTSGSCVIAADYDADGDLDLFVAGRSAVGAYPDIPRSYLLRNDKGRFTDVTATVAPGLEYAGMVTAALWTDFDNDSDPDLMVTGEWMNIQVYRNDGKTFTNITNGSGLDACYGWWNSLTGADFDNDGDIDYVAGNLGLNVKSTRRATQEFPVQLYANDFDGTGSRDLIMTYYYQGTEYPVRNRRDLTNQMPSYIARKFPTFASYAATDIGDMYSHDKLDSAIKLKATTFANSYIQNMGNGKFRISPLHSLAQISPIYGTAAFDFNNDGNMDILAVENFYAPDGDIVRYDAGYGQLMFGNGMGGFTSVSMDSSGFNVPGDGRSLALVKQGSKGHEQIIAIAGNNNGYVQSFALAHPSGTELLTIDKTIGYTHAQITTKDGMKRRYEFYRGSGYLSQSSLMITIPPGTVGISLLPEK